MGRRTGEPNVAGTVTISVATSLAKKACSRIREAADWNPECAARRGRRLPAGDGYGAPVRPKNRCDQSRRKASFPSRGRQGGQNMAEQATATPVSPDPAAQGRYDAFLSYARADKAFAVDTLYAAVTAAGKTVWLDVEDIIARLGVAGQGGQGYRGVQRAPVRRHPHIGGFRALPAGTHRGDRAAQTDRSRPAQPSG